MKRTHFTILLLLIALSAYGQITDRIIQGDTSKIINLGSGSVGTWMRLSDTHVWSKLVSVRILFEPEIPKDSAWTDVKIYRMFYPKQTKQAYEIMVANTQYTPGYKYIDIQFRVNGRTTNYTFEEFKKYLWP